MTWAVRRCYVEGVAAAVGEVLAGSLAVVVKERGPAGDVGYHSYLQTMQMNMAMSKTDRGSVVAADNDEPAADGDAWTTEGTREMSPQ